MSNLGGKRPGAGRKAGGKNLRTIAATELVREAQERFPDYNPIAALIALAQDAEKTGDVETARQCHAAVLPYTAPKFRPVECDREAALDYEERLAEIRSRHTARAMKEGLGVFDLANRLERVMQELDAENRAAARPVAPARPVMIAPPVPPTEPADAPAEQTSAHAGPDAPVVHPAPMPTAIAAMISGEPTAYQSLWPAGQTFAECNYDGFEGGFLSDR
jgi:hypothetical protein